MTRKDYIKFAEALKDRRRVISNSDSCAQQELDLTYNVALDNIASDMCSIFARDNGAFDRSRFMRAAGVER